ncbi:hydroxymethylglutaryl-CoA reductase (NADPH) [Patescibacteria group bacterium]|nr:hydroxymethylglutaryl-CoA reductase (NADPH) [Patescibacteria group bacterium]
MKISDLAKKVQAGDLKMHHFEQYFSVEDSIEKRQEIVSRITKSKLEKISDFSMSPKEAARKNCENMIGAIQVPVGVAGPLKINGEYARGRFFFPLATTEGCLVAGVNRGCRASMLSGGVKTVTKRRGITRAPVFKTTGIRESKKFAQWIEDNFEKIKSQVEKTDPHISLHKIKCWRVGRSVHVRFVFGTADAMGMNMAVVACDNVIKNLITKKTGIKCISVTGNMCSDKKPTAINFILGRGLSTWAEVIIKKKDVKKVLKVTPEEIVEVNTRKNLEGSALAGSYGFNAHFANIIAAMFIATGQDPAHVVEGSSGITSAELEKNGDLYFSVHLPSLIIGAVGGGTGLDTQKEALEILGVNVTKGNPGDNVMKLAEVITAAVLAGELSLLSALAANDLARAHVVYGRRKKYKT